MNGLGGSHVPRETGSMMRGAGPVFQCPPAGAKEKPPTRRVPGAHQSLPRGEEAPLEL
jgi:hypothetical protein